MGTGPVGLVFGDVCVIEKLGVQDDGGRHVAKRISYPQAAVRHGRARQRSRTGPCGDCRRFLWAPGPRDHYSGKIPFIEDSRIQDEGVATWLNVVSTPPAAVGHGRAGQILGTGPC